MPYQVERYLQDLVARTTEVLAEELVGVYAAGSIALGAFDPDRSDIDVAVVCRSELPLSVKTQLVGRLRHRALACPARGLELVVYRREVAASGTAEPGFELELNTGPGMDERVTWSPEDRPAGDGLFWYGLDRSILHDNGLSLSGPPAPEVFADLTPADLSRLLLDSLRWWLARPTPAGTSAAPGAEEAVLGGCRALVRHRSGLWLSKLDAARQLLRDGYEPRDVIEDAIAARAGGAPLTGERARLFQQEVLRRISGRG